MAVTAHAGVGRLAARVTGDERLDHAGAERLAQIEGEVGQAERVGERPGLGHRRGRAAAALGVVLEICPQLEGHRDRLVRRQRSAAPPPSYRRRRSWPRACGPARRGLRRSPEPRLRAPGATASAAIEAAWSLPGLRPPSSSSMAATPTRAACNSDRPRTRVTAALPAALAAPQPWATKPASRTRSPSTATEKRISSQHEPPPARASKPPRGRWPLPCGEVR